MAAPVNGIGFGETCSMRGKPCVGEVVRELALALNAADRERQAALLDPDVLQYGTRGGFDEGRVIRGREAVLAYWEEIGDTWESLSFELERLIEGDDVAVAFWRETARTRHSDLEMPYDTASVMRVRNGKIVEMTGYLDREEALRAAGLSDAQP
jgi:ketosteroid isomerase-like protein